MTYVEVMPIKLHTLIGECAADGGETTNFGKDTFDIPNTAM